MATEDENSRAPSSSRPHVPMFEYAYLFCRRPYDLPQALVPIVRQMLDDPSSILSNCINGMSERSRTRDFWLENDNENVSKQSMYHEGTPRRMATAADLRAVRECQTIVNFVRERHEKGQISAKDATAILDIRGESLDWKDSLPDWLVMEEASVPNKRTLLEHSLIKRREMMITLIPELALYLHDANIRMLAEIAQTHSGLAKELAALMFGMQKNVPPTMDR